MNPFKRLDKKMTLQNFLDLTRNDIPKQNRILASRPKLIPPFKFGDEKALTSIFLSSLSLIDEFRASIYKELKYSRAGKQYFFTEVRFPGLGTDEVKESYLDGLIISVKSGMITDAIAFEMKQGNNKLEKDQIQRYLSVCEKVGIKKFVTISNELVSNPTQSPLKIKKNSKVELLHLSWSEIITKAEILLFDNDTNIKDIDQVNIMREVTAYFNTPKSGVSRFHQMKPGWKITVENIKKGLTQDRNNSSTIEAINSWRQEERDAALMLSRKLGFIVKNRSSKKIDHNKQLDEDFKLLKDYKRLHSSYIIDGAVSNIDVIAHFEKKSIEYKIQLDAIEKPTLKAQIGWLCKQVEKCRKILERNTSDSKAQYLLNNLVIELSLKNTQKSERFNLTQISECTKRYKGKSAKHFGIIYSKDLGASFSSVTKFVNELEVNLELFYGCLVSHLTQPVKKAPLLRKTENFESIAGTGSIPPIAELIEEPTQSNSSLNSEIDSDIMTKKIS